MNSNEKNNQIPGLESNDHLYNSSNSEKTYDSSLNQTDVVNQDAVRTIENEEGNESKEKVHVRDDVQESIQLDSDTVKGQKPSRKQNKSLMGKGFIKTVAAGVVGSVITLSVLPFTDYSEWVNSSNSTAQVENKSEYSSSGSKSAVNIQNTKSTGSSIADVVEEALPAIVGIVNIQQSQSNPFFPQQGQQSNEGVEAGSGSGVIFKKDSKYAYIVTNNHVIENAQEIEVSLESGEKTKAQLIGTDALSDLAVLTIDAKYAKSTLDFGDSSVLRAGEQVVAIGNPLGLDFSRTVTQGIVSAVNRSVAVSTSAGEWEMNVIQTDAAINSGNSGGALINTEGQIIGINSMKIAENGVEGLGFAIPSNDVVPIINEIIDKGKVERVYVGVGLASLEEIPQYYLQNLPQDIESGVMVTSVDQNSAAYRAGIQVQDVIVGINDTNISNSTEFRKYLYSKLKVGDKASIKLYRQGQLKTVEVTLSSTGASSY